MQYIFVDESRISKGRFQLFGSLWLPREKQEVFRYNFWQLWSQEFPSRRSELKWTKVSKGKLETYKKFVDLFLFSPQIDFRCVVLDTHTIDYQQYHKGDKELGFYKFLFFFLSRNIEKDYQYRNLKDNYQVFIDSRRKSDEVGRLTDLKLVLNRRLANTCTGIKLPVVRNVEAVPDSRVSPEIQIIDVLVGAAGYTWEGFQTSKAKLSFISYLERMLEFRLNQPTPYITDKFNIWKFRLQEKQKSAPLPTPC